MNWILEEHMHALEEACVPVEYPCRYEQPTGDKKWPVLCLLDNRYASQRNCYNCHDKRRVDHE